MAAAQCYNLKVDGEVLWDLAEADILELFRSGRVTSSTPCRLKGALEWQNVNEFFPLFKYGAASWEVDSSYSGVPLRVGHGVTSSNSGWKIGIGCFALGLLCAGAVTLLSRKTPSPDRLPSPTSYALTAPRSTLAISQEVTVPTRGSVPPSQRTYAERSKVQPVYTSSSRSAQGGIQNRVAVNPQPVSKPQVKPEEITIPLEQWTTVTSAYGSFQVKIRDHGPVTISVWLGYSDNPRRIDKEKGFETTGTNIVQIHSLGRAKVYYVDRIGVSVGYCVLKIIPNS